MPTQTFLSTKLGTRLAGVVSTRTFGSKPVSHHRSLPDSFELLQYFSKIYLLGLIFNAKNLDQLVESIN